MTSVRYNILKDGDKQLKGDIGELLFKKIGQKIYFPNLLMCQTWKMRDLFEIFGRLGRYNERLNCSFRTLEEAIIEVQYSKPVFKEDIVKAKEKLANVEIKIIELAKQVGLNYTKVHENIECGIDDSESRCVICGRMRENVCFSILSVRQVRLEYAPYAICMQCYDVVNSAHYYDEFRLNLEELNATKETYVYLKYLDNDVESGTCMKILSEMNKLSNPATESSQFADWRWLEFLKELYDKDHPLNRARNLAHATFDFIGVDIKNGHKMLIEIKSTYGSNVKALSKKQREYAKKAKPYGFTVVVPHIRYLDNWNTLIEIKPLRISSLSAHCSGKMEGVK